MPTANRQPIMVAGKFYGADDHQAIIEEISRYARATHSIALEAIQRLYGFDRALAIRLEYKADENERASNAFLNQMRGENAESRRSVRDAPDDVEDLREIAEDLREGFYDLRRLVIQHLRRGYACGEIAIMLWAGSALAALIWFFFMK